MKISVIGAGYVGLSMAVLLSRKYQVVALDIILEKVEMINNKKSPIADREIEEHLKNNKLNLTATIDYNDCAGSDYFIIATPTNYDPDTDSFNTDSIEDAMDNIENISPESVVIIKSTVPIGYTSKIHNERKNLNVIYSPEFLREGRSLYDNLYPSRIVVGTPDGDNGKAERFAYILKECSLDANAPILITGSTEAEAIKLFSNSYLAMRVSFFNELDSFSEVNGLSSWDIIRGVSLDSRIGDYYNNPSFGYGGYCLPKDTMQLRSSYGDTPHPLISAVVESNDGRKRFVANRIMKMAPSKNSVIGAFRMNMKTGSDNDRKASILDVMAILKSEGYDVVIYEPALKNNNRLEYRTIKCLDEFKRISDIIIANRISEELKDVVEKVYTRDVYSRD
jgi:UDPglucose 6-dehydrogenase